MLLDTNPQHREQLSKDTVYKGHPDYVYRAHDFPETREIIAHCFAKKIPITFCGSQTSMTGSSVANEGLALSLAQKNRILDIGIDPQTQQPFVLTEPGVILADLKRQVAVQGFFYPPDPTSFQEARIGATVATNATGEDTFKYGPTRHYVQEMEVITAQGDVKTLKRTRPVPHTLIKNTAGYYLGGEEIDEVIGSEGTLCLISKVKLRLLSNQGKNIFLLILPFSAFHKCLEAAVKLIQRGDRPRAIELIGPGATEYFQRCPQCPEALKSENCFLYIKDEYSDDQDFEKKMAAWFSFLEKLYREVNDKTCLERITLAKSDRQLADIHACRHFIPLKVNEEYFYSRREGGGKVGSDWWVPTPHIKDMMLWTFTQVAEFKIPFLVFAHIGNGHPHWNFLTRDDSEKRQAMAFVTEQCRRAVMLGGGVAGEHGIGKIKRDLMAVQHSPEILKQMLAVKQKWDPDCLFGRDNIFPCKSSKC